MKNLKKENEINKKGLADDEIAIGSKEANTILNTYVETPLVILERNKKFDSNFNNINYNIKMKELWKSVYEFSGKYHDQILILAMGGHDCALKLAEPDILIDFMDQECKHNGLLNRLKAFYYEVESFSEELSCFVGEQKDFIEKEEIEVFMGDWYK